MSLLAPFDVYLENAPGTSLELPTSLKELYGRLSFPAPDAQRPHVFGNFVETIDGVTAMLGHKAGGDISGRNAHDHLLMGLLRACASAVIVGAGTLRDSPNHLWTPEYMYSEQKAAFHELRQKLGLTPQPLNVIVTQRGTLDLSLPVFQSSEVSVLIVTTPAGAQPLREQALPPATQIAESTSNERLSAVEVLRAVRRTGAHERVLVEGGPQLMGSFLAEKVLNELFLTIAPQVAGRAGAEKRPGFVDGQIFAPDKPLWSTLQSLRRADSHLFLRYAFEASDA